VIPSEHSRHTRCKDRLCTNEAIGAGQGGQLEREGYLHLDNQIKHHAERKPPQTQLLVSVHVGGLLETVRKTHQASRVYFFFGLHGWYMSVLTSIKIMGCN